MSELSNDQLDEAMGLGRSFSPEVLEAAAMYAVMEMKKRKRKARK